MKYLKNFFSSFSFPAILLAIMAFFAILIMNSPARFAYEMLLNTPLIVQIAKFSIDKPLLLWINDGLMSVFFLLVSLEIKREVLEGYLSQKDKIALPAFATIGGMVFPSLFYIYFNWNDLHAMRGWAIPVATDIAFALGVLSLLGNRVPKSLTVCLLAISILDDLAAIIIIAIFYTTNLSIASLILSLIALCVLLVLNLKNVSNLTPYILVGIFLWACVLKSGVHATCAGVILALFIPIKIPNSKVSPLKKLENALHPWVAFGILPVFAFANAGVSFEGLSLAMLLSPITLGIACGLFFGKQFGVMFMSGLAVVLKLCKLPQKVSWLQYYGMSLLTGIGFTMSLFIGTLAFYDIETQSAVRLGVLIGSFFSAFFGFVILLISNKYHASTKTVHTS